MAGCVSKIARALVVLTGMWRPSLTKPRYGLTQSTSTSFWQTAVLADAAAKPDNWGAAAGHKRPAHRERRTRRARLLARSARRPSGPTIMVRWQRGC